MCQLNIYIIKNDIEEDKIRQCFDNNNCFDNITDEFEEFNYGNFNFYHCSGMRCDCGSVVSKLQENPMPYDEYWNDLKKKKIEEFSNVKKLITKEGFKEECEKVRKKYDEIKDQDDKIKWFQENLMYFQVPVYEIMASGNGYESVEKYLDDEIYKYENNLHENSDFNDFEMIKENLKRILEIADSVKLFGIWQGEDFVLEDVKTVKFEDFKIDDVASLRYGEILTIEK